MSDPFEDIISEQNKLNKFIQRTRLKETPGAFTSGSVLFAKANGNIGQDNANLFWDDTNNRLIIGTSNTPAGGGKLILRGTDSSISDGPHIQTHGSADVYPILQVLSYKHDNVGLAFDAYFDGAWKSSDAGSNFWLYKTADKLKIFGHSGVSAGSATSLDEIFSITPAGAATFASDIVATAGTVQSLGSGAGLVFDDRATATVWQWYGSTTANLYNGSANVLQIGTTGIVDLVGSAKAVRMGGLQVLSTPATGWATPAGTLLRGTFNSGTATAAQVAQTLAALITDLFTHHGILGT